MAAALTDRRIFMKPEEMRYCSGGEVHLPFHGSTFTGLKFLYNEYGYEAVDEVLTATGQKVYKSIHERLKNGDTSELLCFWRYYLEREKCDFTLTENSDGTAVLELRECPAMRQLAVENIPDPDGLLCYGTEKLNQAWCENSPFEIVVEHLEKGCRQTLRRKGDEK